MSRFIDPNAEVAVSDGVDTIYIRAKMSMDIRSKVSNDLLRLKMTRSSKKDNNEMEGTFSADEQRKMLLIHNIRRWEGPGFSKSDERGVLVPLPCNRANKELLDVTDPLIEKVLEEINQRNLSKTERDKLNGDDLDPKEEVTFKVSEVAG